MAMDNLLGIPVSPEIQGLFGDPSAQLPQPGVTPSAPQGAPAPMPTPTAAPTPPTPPTNPKQSFLGRVHDALLNSLGGGTPLGYEGMLSPEEIASTQPSLLQAMFHSPDKSTAEIRQEKLDHLIGLHMQAASMAQQRNIIQGRRDIVNEIGLPQNGDPAEDRAWVLKAMPRFIANGDYQAVQRLSPLVDHLLPAPNMAGDAYVGPAGQVQYFSKQPGSEVPAGWKRLPPVTAGYKQYVDTNGNVQVLPESVAPPAGWKTVATNNVNISQAGANQRADATHAITLQGQYRRDIQPLTKNALQYDKALYTLQRAATSPDPNERKALYGSVYSQFVQSGDQPNNLRFQLLKYYEHNINPTIAGSFDIFLNKITKGELPQPILSAMMNHIRGLREQTYQQIEGRRTGFLNSNKGIIDESQLPTTDTYFPFREETDALTPGAAGKKYSPNNPFAPKASH